MNEQQITLHPDTQLVDLNLIPYTVFVTVGPSMCGKSSASLAIQNLAKAHGMTCVILSSDKYRDGLLEQSGNYAHLNEGDGLKAHRHSDSMASMSRFAFEKLMTDLNVYTSFPVNTHVVIVDTTGFSERFRQEVCDVAKNNRYRKAMLCFEFAKRSEYYTEQMTEAERETVWKAIDTMRKKVLPNLKAAMFDERVRIKSRYSMFTSSAMEGVTMSNFRSVVPGDKKYAVIGDSHECVEELQELISSIEAKHEGIQIVHIGDYLDKGGETVEMVKFMHQRAFKHNDQILTGNHEAYLARRLKGEISAQPDVEAQHFQAMAVLEAPENKETLQKFLDLWEVSIPFLVINPANEGEKPVYITHAPCESTALGKWDNFSIKDQRNYRIKDRTVSIYEDMAWLFNDADGHFPLHIFGHVSHKVKGLEDWKPLKYRNRVFLDTGCVYGGSLSAVIIENGRILERMAVQAKKVRKEAVLPESLGYGPPKVFDIDKYELSMADLRLLRIMEQNGIRYISGTMSPGPSTATEIEPLDAAFRFLESRGVKEVILEPKYMGSRDQLYLFKDQPEKTFMVSRGGWKIRGLDGYTEDQYKVFLQEQYTKYVHLLEKRDSVIVDCELMPWSALGADLITNSFDDYVAMVDLELATLAQDQRDVPHLTQFFEDKKILGKQAHLEKFVEVLARYSTRCKDGKGAYLEPFNILSDMPVGKEVEDSFLEATAGKSPYFIVEIGDALDEKIAKDFFNNLTVENGMEGVVIKPTDGGDHNIPYMKVRSPEYLRLVYGYDYPDRLEKLCKQKRISGKLNLSIEEAKLGHRMLTAKTPDEIKDLAVQMIGKIKQEQGLDPRL